MKNFCTFVAQFQSSIMQVSKINREILSISPPAIIANIAEPLLGLFDTGIAGHLGAPQFIGAVAVGAMMMNVLYWNFGFLRMGTSGLTAQAFGSGDHNEQVDTLQRSSAIALIAGVAMVILKAPLQWLLLLIMDPSPEVATLAGTYFSIVVWGAPAVLVTMSIKGWLLGMQDSRSPMIISIGVNVLNVIISLIAVYALDMGFKGIAIGTLVSVWVGVIYACWRVKKKFGDIARSLRFSRAFDFKGSGRFFKVNSDIFVRCIFMLIVNMYFIRAGAQRGDMILAINTMIQQLFHLYSYFMDGIAFAGEAVVGKYYGARDYKQMHCCVRWLFVWSTAITAIFVITYSIFPHAIFTMFTNQSQVVEAAMDYRWWCAIVPVVSMAAFVWDGVFIGVTATRGMLLAVVTACAVFFLLYFYLPISLGNHALWIAFIGFLSIRSIVQTIIWIHNFHTSSNNLDK